MKILPEVVSVSEGAKPLIPSAVSATNTKPINDSDTAPETVSVSKGDKYNFQAVSAPHTTPHHSANVVSTHDQSTNVS